MSVLPSDKVAYERLRVRTQELITKLGRGTNQRASYELELNATTISRVIRGLEINEPVLQQVAEWAEKRVAQQSPALLATAV